MEKEVLVAIVGAIGTVTAAALGAYGSIRTKRAEAAKARVAGRLLAATYRFEAALLAAAIIVAAVFVTFGHQLADSVTNAATGSATEYQSLIGDGVRLKKNYVIPGVTMMVRLERDPATSRLTAETHVIYVVHFLNDVVSRSGRGFNEFFHSTSSQNIDYLPGSDREMLTESAAAGMKAWDIFFDAKAGQRRSIVTASQARYGDVLPDGRAIHFFKNVKSNEDAFCYPNTEGDVIGNFLLIVESSSLDLSVRSGDVNAGKQNGNTVTPVEPMVFSEKLSSPKRRTVVARFDSVNNNEVVGLKVTW